MGFSVTAPPVTVPLVSYRCTKMTLSLGQRANKLEDSVSLPNPRERERGRERDRERETERGDPSRSESSIDLA